MNRAREPLEMKPDVKKLIAPSVVGLILFLIFQVFPSIRSESAETSSPNVISKEQAAEAAARFAGEEFGLPALDPMDTLVTYQSNSELYGYLAKVKKLQDYNKSYEAKYPYDVYRVRFTLPGSDALNVDVHMQHAGIVGFSHDSALSSYDRIELSEDHVQERMLQAVEEGMTLADKQALAEPWVRRAGYDPSRLQLVTREGDPKLTYMDTEAAVADSRLQLVFTFEFGSLRSFEPAFSVPASHTTYVNKQTQDAMLLTLVGYGLFTLVLGILAIVYSVKTRAHTSFKRGLLLSALLFVIQMLNTYNLIPVFKSQGISQTGIAGMMIFYAVYSLIFSALLYFSLVGGSGLWRKEDGLNPWPQAKEPGYGRYVLESMKLGYLWAFILLGVQTLIFIALGLTLNTWSTTDASQSPYNMLYPWLFPLMAWLAGISEEAVYRLFGIRMVKKIVRSTFVASLITSLIWAFGHTLYPIYPIISRPIELVIIGLLFSYIFLKHGYIAVMFSHVIFNSVLMGLSLVMMQGASNVLTGLFYMVLPAIVAYVIYRWNRAKKEKPYVTTPHLEGH